MFVSASMTFGALFSFAEYPVACYGDEGERRTLRSLGEAGWASENSADTS